jgi:hypothetical protein
MRLIAIVLVVISLIWVILQMSGVSGLPPSYIRTVLLVIAVILILTARRKA